MRMRMIIIIIIISMTAGELDTKKTYDIYRHTKRSGSF